MEDFKRFFSERLARELSTAESARKATIFKAVLVWVFAIPLAALATWGIASWMGMEYLVAVAVLIALIVGFLSFMLWREILASRRFYTIFKARVIDNIVRFVDERLHYIPHRYIPPATLVKSRLFAKPIHKYEGDDYCFMQLDNGMLVEFSEVHAATIKKTNGNRETVPIFDGLFAHVHCVEPRVGDLYILPKGMSEADLYQPGRLHLHETDDPEFNGYFTVYASSGGAVRQYLSQRLIRALVEFRRAYPERTILLATHGKELYLGISCKTHFFEPDVWVPLTNIEALETFFMDISVLMKVINAAVDLSGEPVPPAAQPA